MMSFAITPAFPSRGGTQGSGLSFAIGRVARRWGRPRRNGQFRSETEFIDLRAGLFPFSLPFWRLLPVSSVPWSSWTFDALLKFRHGIVGQRRARVKALD